MRCGERIWEFSWKSEVGGWKWEKIAEGIGQSAQSKEERIRKLELFDFGFMNADFRFRLITSSLPKYHYSRWLPDLNGHKRHYVFNKL